MRGIQCAGPIGSGSDPRRVRRWRYGTIAVMAFVALLSGRSVAQLSTVCIGDCNGDGRVRVNELILGLQTELGVAPYEACSAIDCNKDSGLGIYIACFPIAVNNAMLGCDRHPGQSAYR